MSILADEAVQQVRELVKRALRPGSYETQALHRAMHEIAAIIGVDEERSRRSTNSNTSSRPGRPRRSSSPTQRSPWKFWRAMRSTSTPSA